MKKYRVTYTIVTEASDREDAKEKLLDILGVENSDYADIDAFKNSIEVVRV